MVSVVVSGWVILGQFEICDHLWSGFRGGDPLPNLISSVSFCLWRLQAAEIQAKERDMAAIKAAGSVQHRRTKGLAKSWK